MSRFPKYSENPCRKWRDDKSARVGLYGKCCASCMKQVQCKDNPDDYFDYGQSTFRRNERKGRKERKDK